MVLTVSQSILNALNDRYSSKKVHHYTLPRQVGATTFIADVAEQALVGGKRVLYLGQTLAAADAFYFVIKARNIDRKNFTITSIGGKSQASWAGHRFDLILAENLMDKESDWQYFLAQIMPLIVDPNTGASVLRIDTVA